MSSVLVVGVLGALWLAVLAPPLMRSRSAHRKDADFSAFYSSLSQLRPRGAAAHGPARTPQATRLARRRTAQRRMRVYTTLLGSTAVSFILGSLADSRPMWILFGLSVALIAVYTLLIVWVQRSAAQRVDNIAYLPVRLATPEFALRRTVNS